MAQDPLNWPWLLPGPACAPPHCPSALTHASRKASLLGMRRPRNSSRGHPSLLPPPGPTQMSPVQRGCRIVLLKQHHHLLSCLCCSIFLPRTWYLPAYHSFSHLLIVCLRWRVSFLRTVSVSTSSTESRAWDTGGAQKHLLNE